LKKIRAYIGLDKCLLTSYGAAPLKPVTVDFFAGIDVPLFNLWGLSESTGGIVCHYYNKYNLDACGPAVDYLSLTIENPDKNGDGEICTRGRGIMMGYLKNEEATRKAVNS